MSSPAARVWRASLGEVLSRVDPHQTMRAEANLAQEVGLATRPPGVGPASVGDRSPLLGTICPAICVGALVVRSG